MPNPRVFMDFSVEGNPVGRSVGYLLNRLSSVTLTVDRTWS